MAKILGRENHVAKLSSLPLSRCTIRKALVFIDEWSCSSHSTSQILIIVSLHTLIERLLKGGHIVFRTSVMFIICDVYNLSRIITWLTMYTPRVPILWHYIQRFKSYNYVTPVYERLTCVTVFAVSPLHKSSVCLRRANRCVPWLDVQALQRTDYRNVQVSTCSYFY